MTIDNIDVQIDENLKLGGNISFAFRDKYGDVYDIIHKKNRILNSGREQVAKLINGVSVAPFNKIQLGTDGTATTDDDVALGSFYIEQSATVSYVAPYKPYYRATILMNETVTIREAAIANGLQVSSPQLLSRVVIPDRTVKDGDAIEVIWRTPII